MNFITQEAKYGANNIIEGKQRKNRYGFPGIAKEGEFWRDANLMRVVESTKVAELNIDGIDDTINAISVYDENPVRFLSSTYK